jgi:hypothetical protein
MDFQSCAPSDIIGLNLKFQKSFVFQVGASPHSMVEAKTLASKQTLYFHSV